MAPDNLAVCRIVFFGAMFFYYLPRDVSAWAGVSSAFWDPVWIFDGRLRLPLLSATHPVLSTRTLDVIQVAWKIALALSCAGVLTRVSTAVSFVFGVQHRAADELRPREPPVSNSRLRDGHPGVVALR